jgi:hypothetical protein
MVVFLLFYKLQTILVFFIVFLVISNRLFFCCYKTWMLGWFLDRQTLWGLRWVSHSHSSNIADFFSLIKASLLWIRMKGINQKCFMTESSNFHVFLFLLLSCPHLLQMWDEAVSRNTWNSSEINVNHSSLILYFNSTKLWVDE